MTGSRGRSWVEAASATEDRLSPKRASAPPTGRVARFAGRHPLSAGKDASPVDGEASTPRGDARSVGKDAGSTGTDASPTSSGRLPIDDDPPHDVDDALLDVEDALPTCVKARRLAMTLGQPTTTLRLLGVTPCRLGNHSACDDAPRPSSIAGCRVPHRPPRHAHSFSSHQKYPGRSPGGMVSGVPHTTVPSTHAFRSSHNSRPKALWLHCT